MWIKIVGMIIYLRNNNKLHLKPRENLRISILNSKPHYNIIERKSRFLDLKVGTSDYVPCYGE